VATAFVSAWSYLIFKILFTEQYLSGYIVAPYLFLAPLLQMLFQVAANQFIVVKKTWPNLLVLSIGAVLNIIINRTLIPLMGIEGAAIATLVGYIVSDIICVIVLCWMKLMVVSSKFIVATLVMVGYIVAWRLLFSNGTLLGTVVAVIFTIVICLIYRDDVIKVFNMVKGNRKS
jgi:O-antigen/teichoic acid export membrane protein